MPEWQPPFYWRYTIREVRRRPLRSLLTLVGIVLGVAAVAAVNLASDATLEGYAGMYRLVAGRARLELVPAAGQGTFAPRLEVLDALQGVTAAPIVLAPASLATERGPQAILVLGVDRQRDQAVREYRLLEGEWFTTDGVLLEAGFARRHGCAVGRPIRLLSARGTVEVEVVGLLAASGPARFNGGAIAFLPLKRAQSLFTAPGEVTAVQLVLDKEADAGRVSAFVEARMPGLMVQSPEVRGQLAAAFLFSITPMLRSLSAIAVVAGALVILNTFLMNLGERRRQLALLRALGATGGQVTGLLVRQALLLGGVGTLLGLPAGVLLAALLVRVNESFLNVPLPAVPLTVWPLLLAAVLGPTMTLLATILPARRAAFQPPLAGLRMRGGHSEERPLRWPILLGMVLLVGVALFETAVIRGWLAPLSGVPYLPLVVAAGLVGCSCLLPAALPALLRVSGWVVSQGLGVEGRLAVRQLSRQRARAGLTVGVLFAAVTACLAFGLSFLNNMRDIHVWLAATIEADYLVRAVRPDPALIVTPSALPAGTAERVQQLPGCASVKKFRFQPTRVGTGAALVIAREFPAEEDLPFVLHAGDPEDVRKGLARGEAVLGTTLAARLGVDVGDEVTLPGADGPQRIRVAGVAKEYTVGGMALYLGWEAACRWLGFDEAHGLAVRPRPGEEAVLAAELARYCREHGLLMQTNSDFAGLIYRVASGVQALVAGMVALVFLVAAVGVVNTLATNVIDQTRELGVLRALGMKRGQVSKLVLGQALVLGLVSCLPGVPAGVLLAYLMNRAVPGLLGHHVPFRFEGWYVLGCTVGVLALAAAAALLPARRAARLAVVDALRQE